MFRKLFFICSLLVMVLVLGGCNFSANALSEINVEILQMNDIHGHIEEEASITGGLAASATIIDSIRAEDNYDNTILIANGDMLQETAISRVSYGEVVISAMNEMGFDAMGIGNHEFDWGLNKILNYFDGNLTNGEANFPLLNANIYQGSNLVKGTKVMESLLIEKEHVKVGIISYIGDVYNSISSSLSKEYNFKAKASDIANSVLSEGTNLKKQGADIIIVNIHGGDSSGVTKYSPNNQIAKLKYGDDYLVDAIINGHTHTRQDGFILRTGGTALPIIQSSGSLRDFGRIDLTFDTTKKVVTKAKCTHINTDKNVSKNTKVLNVINNYYNQSKNVLEEVYCQNETQISRYSYNLYHYAANVMMAATSATAAICNTGAFRNNVDPGNFDFSALYALNPFDNHIILTKIKGIDLKRFYDANKDFEFVYTKDYGASIATDEEYILAIIDYVFFGNYFASYRTNDYVDTNLILRDLLILDLRLRKDTNFNINYDYDKIKISPQYLPSNS